VQLLHTINANPGSIINIAPLQIRTFVAQLVAVADE